MSCQIHVYIVCEKCGHKHEAVLDSRINGCIMADTKKIGTDTLNMVICPNCGYESRAKFPVLYENIYTKTVAWYRPCKGTDDFFEMVKKTFLGNRTEKYKDKVQYVSSWKKFKDIFSKDIFKHSMDMAFSTSSGEQMGKSVSDRQLASILLEFGMVKLLKERTNLSLDVPEFTLQDSSCIYTGYSQVDDPLKHVGLFVIIILFLLVIFALAGL